MGLTIEFIGNWDSLAKDAVQDSVRRSIGEPPDGETWHVSLTSGFFQDHCEVRVTTSNQVRSRLFLDRPEMLPDAVARWIARYPLV